MSANKSFSTETSQRYALALFELAEEKSELSKVEESIKELLLLYNSNNELERFIKNPVNPLDTQLLVIKKVSEIMKLSKTLENFLSILVVKRRIFYIKKIIESFLKIIAKKKGELSASLESSKKLSSEDIVKITDALSEAVGSVINFTYKVDPSLIGGIKVQIGSLMIDSSIKNKLKKYQQLMIEK